MKHHRSRFRGVTRLVGIVLGVGLTAGVAGADVSVPAIFSDNMMLQRGSAIPVWGKADAGEKVSVSLVQADGKAAQQVKSAEATAGADGKWMVHLDLSQAPDQAYRLVIHGNNQLEIGNVLIGQVWLASGQSNMEWPVRASRDAKREIAEANFPRIRHFIVQKRVATHPTEELAGRWEEATPEHVGAFTAVGYFFARTLYQQLDVPVGIIHSSWGGTPGEAWVSAEGLAPVKDFDDAIERVKKANDPAEVKQYEQDLAQWLKNVPATFSTTDAEKRYTQPDFDDSGWKPMNLPGMVENAGMDVDGVIWFRRTVTLPQAPEKEATLQLGVIDDFDVVYVNGIEVGSTPADTTGAASRQRTYKVPAKVLHEGENTLAIRVLDTGGPGGFAGPANRMRLVIGEQNYPLNGAWRVHPEPGIDPQPLKAFLPTLPRSPGGNQHSPTTLFNGMINPIIPYGIAGAIWYQGESNAGRHEQYDRLLQALIRDWRTRWDQPKADGNSPAGTHDFPFYIVQLANFMAYREDPAQTGSWPYLRQAQQNVADTVPNTGLANIIDLGEEKDIHPRNKQDVGRRLALIALAKTYGKDVEYSGPRLQGVTIGGPKLLLRFSHTDKGLATHALDAEHVQRPSTLATLMDADTPVKGFTLRDAEGKWHFAHAEIVKPDTVAVWAEGVDEPTAVRYAFADNPVATLYNSAGLPANPFEVVLSPDK